MNTSHEEMIDLLASHRTVGKAPREELAWIAENGLRQQLQQGEMVAAHTEVVQKLHIMLSGLISIYVNRGSGLRKEFEWKEGDVWGALPYSRMTNPPGDTIVEEPTDVVTIRRDQLPELIRNCHQVTASMVHIMLDRARRFTSTDLRDEKMRSLGKLAAGFAHEVNNPASAALRDAKSLASTLSAADEAARELFTSGLTKEQLAELDILCEVCKRYSEHQEITGLELADREDAIEEWLNDHNIPADLAEDLARLSAGIEDLDRLARTFESDTLALTLRWIAGAFAGRSLVANIERAATRIHTLVAAAKGFTHMDRAPDLESVDIGPGIADTVALLGGRARGKSVTLEMKVQEDLPSIRGYTSEINQIWMNLIDNAIDASPTQGQVTVSAILEGADVIVLVEDNGSGIPHDIKESIFDPFVTTKPVGEGTGLGLDIVRRVVDWHNGEIHVDSEPGRTEFRVRLPIAGAEMEPVGSSTRPADT
jgi:signal transduction histidine kinase